MRRIWLWLLVLPTIATAEPLPVPFAQAAGQRAPTSNDALREAFEGHLPVLIDFTGDAGPERIEQDLVLGKLREALAGEVTFVEVVDETEDGTAAFDDYRVTKIPSLCVTTRDGTIVAAFEGATDEALIHEALRLARVASGIAQPPEKPEPDTPNEPEPVSAIASAARPGTPVEALAGEGIAEALANVRGALTGGKVCLVLFHGEWGAFSRQQMEVLTAARPALGPGVESIVYHDGRADHLAAFEACGVRGVPTMLLVNADGRIAKVWLRVVTQEELLEAVAPIAPRPAQPLPGPVVTDPEPRVEPEAAGHPLIGQAAPPSTEILALALASKRPTALFFQGAAQTAEAADNLRELKQGLVDRANVITIRDQTPEEEQAWDDYRIEEAPTVCLIGTDGLVKGVLSAAGPVEGILAALTTLLAAD